MPSKKSFYLIFAFVLIAAVMLITIFSPKKPTTVTAPPVSTQSTTNSEISLPTGSVYGPVTAQVRASFNKVGNSNITGETTFTEVDGKVYVAVALANASTKIKYPAFIYSGTCQDTTKPIKYSLSPVVKGKTENYIAKTMAEIKKELPLSVKILKDSNKDSGFVSCAELQ